MRFLLVAALCGLGTVAYAQPGDLKIPTSGFAYDADTKVVRPIYGVPGAAWLGSEVKIGVALGLTVVSPTHDFALAVAEDGQLLLIPLSAAGGQVLPVGGTATTPSRIVFSPSGRAALIVGAALQVITGLPDSPQAREIVPPEGGSWPAMAVSDDGEAVLLASGGVETDPVWLLKGGQARQVPLAGSAQAVAFRANARDAIAITRRGDVFVMREAGLNVDAQQIYYGDERTAEPVAAYFGRNGRRAYTASRSGNLVTIELETAAVTTVSCQCVPTALSPLRSESLFRITEISNDPVMLFDDRGSGPRVWFVPAGASRRLQQGGR